MKQKIIRVDLGGVNSYLLKSANNFILVDTGGHMVMDKEPSDRRGLLEGALGKNGCTPDNLKLIILTHGDIDHTCNAAYLRGKYGCKIAIRGEDRFLVENPSINDFMASFNYRSPMLKIAFKIMRRTIRRVAEKTCGSFETFSPDIMIDENFKLSDFGFEGDIIHIPGHTPGSVGILVDGDIIAGDTLANMGKPGAAPNALDFTLLDKSVDALKAYNINIVYPGHGKPFAFKDLKLHN